MSFKYFFLCSLAIIIWLFIFLLYLLFDNLSCFITFKSGHTNNFFNYRFIIATFMIISQLGICTVFVIFTTDSLRDVSLLQTFLSNAKLLMNGCLLLNGIKIIVYV